MTTIALPDRWDYAGIDDSTFAQTVISVEGADELPPLRGSNLVVPGIHGRYAPGEDEFDERTITQLLFLHGANEAGGLTEANELIQAQRNLERAAKSALDRTLKPLGRTLPDGTRREGLARIIEFSVIPAAGYAGQRMRRRFVLPNPWLYGADVVVTPAIAASPTAFNLTQPGLVATHRVVFDFTGPIANPRITHLTTGTYVECLVTVAAAAHLIIDGAAFTATNDAINAIGSIRHSGDRRWLVVAPGLNAIEVSASTPGGSLTTTLRVPYL